MVTPARPAVSSHVRGSALVLVACLFAAPRAAADDCGVPRFQPAVRYASAANQAVLLADVNGDGAPDILASGNHVEQLDAFSLLPNLGDGAFGGERRIPSRFGERLEQAVDLDADGIPDLVAANYWQNGITVYRGLGALQFAAGTPYDTATHGGPSRVADYDGDGTRDVVSLSFGSGNPVRVHLFRGRGDGTFDPKQTFVTPFPVADTPSIRTRAGALELLAADRSGVLVLLRITPTGVTSSALPAGPGTDLNCTFVDVNGDQLADVVNTNDGGPAAAGDPYEWIFVRLARPDGTFGDPQQLALPRRMSLPTELRTGDLNGDGAMDLVVSDFQASTLLYFRGRGNGTFDPALPIDAGAPVNDIAIGDLNGDRRPDLVTVNKDHSVSVILNAGRDCGPARRRAVRH